MGIWGDHLGSQRNEFVDLYKLVHPEKATGHFGLELRYHPSENLVADIRNSSIPTVFFVPKNVLAYHRWSHDQDKLSITGSEMRAFLSAPETMKTVTFVYGALDYPLFRHARYKTR